MAWRSGIRELSMGSCDRGVPWIHEGSQAKIRELGSCPRQLGSRGEAMAAVWGFQADTCRVNEMLCPNTLVASEISLCFRRSGRQWW